MGSFNSSMTILVRVAVVGNASRRNMESYDNGHSKLPANAAAPLLDEAGTHLPVILVPSL